MMQLLLRSTSLLYASRLCLHAKTYKEGHIIHVIGSPHPTAPWRVISDCR